MYIVSPWKKGSRSEKAILGAILGIPEHSRSNSRNGTHDLIYAKTLFSEQLSERLSEVVGKQNLSPNSRSVLFRIGVVPARQRKKQSYPKKARTRRDQGGHPKREDQGRHKASQRRLQIMLSEGWTTMPRRASVIGNSQRGVQNVSCDFWGGNVL